MVEAGFELIVTCDARYYRRVLCSLTVWTVYLTSDETCQKLIGFKTSAVHSRKMLCPENLFSIKSQFTCNSKVVCLIIWTYDICAADTGTYCDYYWQNHDCSSDAIKGRPSVQLLVISIINNYSTLLYHKQVNDGLGLKSTAGLKTFMQ